MNYEEGEGSNLYSSMGWALTEVESVPTYLGKWGHRMLAWTVEDGQGGKEPALYFIAGDAVGGGSFVSDVFVSTKTRECLEQKCGMYVPRVPFWSWPVYVSPPLFYVSPGT